MKKSKNNVRNNFFENKQKNKKICTKKEIYLKKKEML